MRAYFNNLKIQTKLIVLFIAIKVVPVILISVTAVYGVFSLYNFFTEHNYSLKQISKQVVSSTATIAIEDSITALDRKSQNALEMATNRIAQSVADFLYERDSDLLLLATLPRDEGSYSNFISAKNKAVKSDTSHLYHYDDATSKWVRELPNSQEIVGKQTTLKDNEKEFHKVTPITYSTEQIPLYKEVVYFDLNGNEQVKVSSINPIKTNVSIRENTYIHSETYFDQIFDLKEGEIYVSDVIGAYIPSRVIGEFTKEKAEQAGIPFKPEEHGFAGRENPRGKRFQGIIRFITPVFENGNKVGFVSLALDHRHIMEFTDTFDPLSNSLTDLADASAGNYAYMWDYNGRGISHPRDYYIAGFDPQTGKRVQPWISDEIEQAFNQSGESDLNEFLSQYPRFEQQSLDKKSSRMSIESGLLGIDCGYLNFAPQCKGWMEVTENGGLGSFIIYWSNVWKLTTAASIPYYTGQYANSSRGFGFVTIGANVKEFHKAAQATQQNLDRILIEQLGNFDQVATKAQQRTEYEVKNLVNELTLSTLVMIILMIMIAVWLSRLLKERLNTLLSGTNEYAKNNLSYRIQVDSNDEIGELARSFNTMASALQKHIESEKELNQTLESRIAERTKQLTLLNERIQQELHQKERQEERLELFAKIFNNTTEAILITDNSGIILQVNPAFTRITGYKSEDVIGETNQILRSHLQPEQFYDTIRSKIHQKEPWQGEIWNQRKNGEAYPALLSIIPILNKHGDIIHFVGIQHDITVIKQNEKALHQQAFYDPLTKLANRTLGYERLEHALENAKEHGHIVSVLFLDLDKFKQVNDTLGHDSGDQLLCEIGSRLNLVCKESDTVCRIGGDEFLIIMEETCYEEVIGVANQLLHVLSQPFKLLQQDIYTATSIGITFYPNDGDEVKTMLKNADIAMYRAKAMGGSTYELFTEELGIEVNNAVSLENQLKEAIDNNEFVMHYQPILALDSQQVVAVEALMRWQQKDQLHYPGHFLEALENSRLIIGATETVIPSIFEFSKKLSQRYDTRLNISINISATHFVQKDFTDYLMAEIDRAGISPTQICLELTETIMVSDIDLVARKLNQLKAVGFNIALDDFGTGYSSLEYFKRLPLDIIKIDRAFIKELPESQGDAAITTSVCSWGDNFNLQVVAEGVETQAQLQFLQQIGCKNVQGYLFAKPMTEEQLIQYLDHSVEQKN